MNFGWNHNFCPSVRVSSRYRAAVRRTISRFILMCPCSRVLPESRTQNAALHLDTTNNISTKTSTTTILHPSSSPKIPTPPWSTRPITSSLTVMWLKYVQNAWWECSYKPSVMLMCSDTLCMQTGSGSVCWLVISTCNTSFEASQILSYPGSKLWLFNKD